MFADFRDKIISRRDFLKESGRLALVGAATTLSLESILLSGCATFDPKKDWSQVPAKEFDIKGFDRWFRENKLYKKPNPNVKSPHHNYSQYYFQANFNQGWTPGIGYSVPWGEVMVAAAPGKVFDVYELLLTGRAGGMMVSVGHADILGRYQTCYAHLNKVFVKTGKKVKRGDPIGNVTEYNNIAKLMLQAGKSGGTWLDPDNYGLNHNYIDYSEDQMEQDNGDFSNNEIIMENWVNQIRVVNRLYDFVKSEKINRFKMHPRANSWDSIEHFRYIETLYEIKPNFFPNLSKDEFQAIKKEFYDNQPIILTLPFIKGGMKKYR